MSKFKITGPGFYKQRDGGKAEVQFKTTDWGYSWYGIDSDNNKAGYFNDGRLGNLKDTKFDLIALWSDPAPSKDERSGDVITGVGFYRTQQNEKAEILGVGPYQEAVGFVQGGAARWTACDGVDIDDSGKGFDITGPWIDPISLDDVRACAEFANSRMTLQDRKYGEAAKRILATLDAGVTVIGGAQ